MILDELKEVLNVKELGVNIRWVSSRRISLMNFVQENEQYKDEILKALYFSPEEYDTLVDRFQKYGKRGVDILKSRKIFKSKNSSH